MSYQADLVSIHSKKEETYVINLIAKDEAESQYFWIGLNNKLVCCQNLSEVMTYFCVAVMHVET